MPISLCVLLWAHPGQHDALVDYEDRVLALVPEHGGQLLQRARSDGRDPQPLEIQVLRFGSQTDLDGYLDDPRRLALAEVRDRAVARTEMLSVTLHG